MADVPVDEVVQVEDVLDGLVDPTSSEVYSAVEPFSNAAVGAVAAKRALSGGGGGGSQTLVDLGTVNVIDLIDGPQTLATPAAGSAFWVLPDETGFVAMDSTVGVDIAPESRIFADYVERPIFQWAAGGTFAAGAFGSPTEVFQLRAIMDGTPIQAVLQSPTSAYPIMAPLAAWQANHAYPAEIVMILDPDDHIWSQTSGGTSGGTIPDFAVWAAAPGWESTHVYAPGALVRTQSGAFTVWSASGGTNGASDPGFAAPGPITDNDITWTLQTDGTVLWTDEGPVPTVGSLHLYALTAG